MFHNIISLFFLTKFVTIISELIFSGFPDQIRGYQGTMHSTE
ncbi:hypothetical protein BS78_02G136400 [Paspalum vaginatum]|nr:hypothetical protein BS78_02G136400 [Paspalum vaginatum]